MNVNLLKIGIISTAFLFFVIACSQTKTIDTNPANDVGAANAPNSQSNAAPTDELTSTRKIYTEQCAKCHKEDGAGGYSTIDGKRIKAPNFTSERMKRDDENDWIETIENGATDDGMPAYKGKISDADIKQLVRLIRRDFQGKP